jgi:hypothetical protein
MINSPVGPAILWQVVYSVLSFVILLFCVTLGAENFYEPAFNVYLGLSIAAGTFILIGTIFFGAQNLPLLGPAAHWLVYHLGPM